MKEALFWEPLKDKEKTIKCKLCPHNCLIVKDSYGKCRVRKNINGKLYSMVYARPCSIATDPIEKKPLYHFLPGQKTLSIATFGCNLFCLHCQNYEISHEFVESEITKLKLVEPEKVVEKAKELGIKVISYTYTEPTIFYEYMYDVAKLAKKARIKNIIVSNGYIQEEPLKKLLKFLDGANIDLKSINNEFYLKVCKAKLEPVLKCLKIISKNKCWLEITNLIIPSLNDKDEEIEVLIDFVAGLGKNIPLHFTAFFPHYKLLDKPSTPEFILLKAREKALKKLNHVYAGNIMNVEANTTYCTKCKKSLIKRFGFDVIENNVKKGKCAFCKTKIAGVFS
ncbi:MAG: AmmeMemoRadiSam system radical SAM enzyme [Candidatus Pacearchaeota archaeon]